MLLLAQILSFFCRTKSKLSLSFFVHLCYNASSTHWQLEPGKPATAKQYWATRFDAADH